MERELVWNKVYDAIRVVAEHLACGPRPQGHPDVYPTWIILVCWLWACLWRLPQVQAMTTLASRAKRRYYGYLGFRLPQVIPANCTVSRRGQRADFLQLRAAVQHYLLDRLLPTKACQTLIVDSSPLDIPTISHDQDARWGHHGHFGYRLHTLLTEDGAIVAEQVEITNVQELTVFPQLLATAAAVGITCRFVAADMGYDSEPAHRATQRLVGGMLVAPLNNRGGRRAFVRTPLRQAMWRRWHSPPLRRARRRRPRIERYHSVLKGPLAIDSLPRHIRGLSRVRRFVLGCTLLYHGYLLEKRAKHAVK